MALDLFNMDLVFIFHKESGKGYDREMMMLLSLNNIRISEVMDTDPLRILSYLNLSFDITKAWTLSWIKHIPIPLHSNNCPYFMLYAPLSLRVTTTTIGIRKRR